MKLSQYIKDLLYRYECVIVPEFGGFIAGFKSASISSNTFRPPYKQISFNGQLTANDGLLANYIAAVDKVPYNSAMNFIRFEVKQWKEHLINSSLILEDIGILNKEGEKVLFNPQKEVNYLTESYGLSPVILNEVKREVYKKQVEELQEKAPILVTQKKEEKPNYLKYAAAVLIGASLIAFGINEHSKRNKIEEVVLAKEQKAIQNGKIQQATFIVPDLLPSIFLEASLSTKPYHVIAGAFRIPENADKMVALLKAKGYENARILGVNQWGLTQVSYDSFTDKSDAINLLRSVQNAVDENAWLLVQDL